MTTSDRVAKTNYLHNLAYKINEAYEYGALHYARALEAEYCYMLRNDNYDYFTEEDYDRRIQLKGKITKLVDELGD